MIKTAPQPLLNIRQELLKLYATGISDEHLGEIKDLISQFLMDKAVATADTVFVKKGYFPIRSMAGSTRINLCSK